MRYKVIDDFNSLTRRFAPGMEVDDSEIDGAVPLERWVEMGKIREARPARPDFVSDQAAMRTAWETGGELVHGAPIMIADHELFGTLRSGTDAATVDVTVFGENFARRYPREEVDLAARTVRGEFSEVTRRMQNAEAAAARDLANAEHEPAPGVVQESDPAAA